MEAPQVSKRLEALRRKRKRCKIEYNGLTLERAKCMLKASVAREHRGLRRAGDVADAMQTRFDRAVCLLRGAGVRTPAKVALRVRARVRSQGLSVVVQGAKKRRQLPWDLVLNVSFGPTHQRNVLARTHDLHPGTVTRCSIISAMSWKSTIDHLLGSLREFVQMRAPSVFGTSLSFDESKEWVNLPIDPDVPLGVSRTSWNCLVSEQRLSWCFGDLKAVNDPHWSQLEALRPPVPMLNNDGECTYEGLFLVDQVKHSKECIDSCLRAAAVALEHYDKDGAGSCARAVAHRMSLALKRGNTLASEFDCGNHQTNLVEVCAMGSMDGKVWPWLYSAVLFLGMGGMRLGWSRACG